MKAKTGTPAEVDSVTGLLLDIFSADEEALEFKSAAELQHQIAERAVPLLRKPTISPPQRPQDFPAPRAPVVAKPENEVPSSKSSSTRQQGSRVWRAAAAFKRESAAARPPSEQQSLWGSRAAAANPGQAASSLSFPPVGLRVWRAAAVARLERPTVSGTAKEPEVAIEIVSNLDEGRGRLSELDGAAGESGAVTPSSPAIEPEASEHLPAADLHDFDLACKRALKEVVFDPDVERRFVNDASPISVPVVRRRSSLKLAACAAVVASVGFMPWIAPSFTEAVPSLAQHYIPIIARPLTTMLSRSQVEEPRSSREAGPVVATVMPLAAPPLASFEKEERSPSASADAPRDLRSTIDGMRETLVPHEAEVRASQITPDVSVASQDRKPMPTASSVPSASRVQPSAAESGAGAARPPEDAQAIVIAPSLRAASEPPVLRDTLSASSRRIESMSRESRKADRADAVVPTELAAANASMLPVSGPRTAEGPAVVDLGSRLPTDRVPKEREPVRSAEPIGVAALPTNRPEMILAERLVERAERLIDLRDVGGARLLLERAVSLGHGRSAHLLAQTYDPSVLRAWGIVGMNGDLSKAKELYDRAKAGALAGTPSP